jgi:carbamoyltransferase
MVSLSKVTWGWTGMSHDASLAVFSETGLEFAAHSERYSRIKNDKNLDALLIEEAVDLYGKPDKIYFYEKPLLKKTRQFNAGQYTLLGKESPTTYIRKFINNAPRNTTTSHHLSHAAYGYYTGPWHSALVLVIDSIGEWETVSLWSGDAGKLKKLWSQNYPHSLGIWYSAMTQRIGLKPQEHEYILMGMAAIGDPDKYYDLIKRDFIEQTPTSYHPFTTFKQNCHRGCMDWRPDLNSVQDYADIAAAVQRIYEEIFVELCRSAYHMTDGKYENIILVGGCALNCVANPLAGLFFKNVHVPANPGDAGSAIGCVLAHRKEFMYMDHAFLGHNIEGEYPVEKILEQLHTRKITAVASGRAEFGPRALGNRSILADPRGSDVKDLVNTIKHREAFRPFAPVILAEHAEEYFEGKVGDFMQYVAKCKQPDLFPAIIHYDNSSRVQTVPAGSEHGIRRLLERWYAETGCPMLLNTSLNIKGEPLVNTREDAIRWTEKYGVDVCVPSV